jgi:type IV secretion system protein VirB9
MLRLFKIVVLVILLLFSAKANALETVGSDSRVRTLIYGRNDVYRVTTTFGYQTTIEFESTEKIKTISLGNSGFFKITPQKNRIFVKGIVPNVLTNMSVITDKRTYQIELSTVMQSLSEIIYLVRFYYPDTEEATLANNFSFAPANSVATVPDVNIPQGFVPGQGMMQAQPQFPSMGMGGGYNQTTLPGTNPVFGSGYNYNYTLTGSEAISPTEVFDDGTKTYFRFVQAMQPTFRIVSPGGGEIPTGYNIANGYYVIDTVSPQTNVYFGSEMVSIYNENMGMR